MNRLKIMFFTSSVTLITFYMYLNNKIYFFIENNANKVHYILYWTTMYNRIDFGLGLGSDIFQGCEFSNCFATSDRNFLEITQFSAMIFHHHDTDSNDLPQGRSPEQRYIFFTLESPSYTTWKPWDDFFNWTMTYRLDSDIVHPYGYIRKFKTGYQKPNPLKIMERPKKIAWLVSNCQTASGRENIAEEINQFMRVDVIGDCNSRHKIECPKNSTEACYDLLQKTYKFYLSFENSLCLDYVTEKFFNILKLDMIPIVYGTANYSHIAPPNSYVNVKDYENVSELVNHLRLLDRNPDLYLKYFDWKEDYAVQIYPKKTLCNLCEKLNRPVQYKTQENLSDWWLDGNCEPKYEPNDVGEFKEERNETYFRYLIAR